MTSVFASCPLADVTDNSSSAFVSPGFQSISLAAIDQALPPGTYEISVEVTDALGTVVPVPATVSGYVNGIRYDQSGPVLMVGVTEFPLSSILEVTN